MEIFVQGLDKRKRIQIAFSKYYFDDNYAYCLSHLLQGISFGKGLYKHKYIFRYVNVLMVIGKNLYGM
jgi:hypothetical protein